MSIECLFTLNKTNFSRFTSRLGSFQAFSGDADGRNNPDAVAMKDHGPIPVGRYHLINRESGGRLGWLRDVFRRNTNWFALYRDDAAIDDQMSIAGITRGQFRMHPKGPFGMSTGCIVFEYPDEFDKFRESLIKLGTQPIAGTALRGFGTVDVVRESRLPADLDQRFQSTGVA